MIIGSLKNTARIEILNPHFKKVFDYIRSHHLTSLPIGKMEIDGENASISVSEVQGKEKNVAKLETHDKYIDIQLPLIGEETFGWQDRKCLKEEKEGGYQEEKDITFYADKPQLYVTLSLGDFVVFFPEDAHAPCIGKGMIKKIVVKVRAF
ncbi:MAG: YhcH/YjgK/YiaL family protein [Odoribacter sp.]